MRKVVPFVCLLQTACSGGASSPFQFNPEQVKAYHESTSSQLENIIGIIESPFFADAKTVLDLGCGDGQMTAFIAKRMPNLSVVGCDVSSSMIAFASKKFIASEYPNLQFLEKDAMNLGFANQFDRVISFNCLHWTSNQQKVLNEIFTSLKPGGKALIIAAPKSQQDDLQTICGELMISAKWAPLFKDCRSTHSFHTEDEYPKLLSGAHLSILKIQPSVRDVVFDSRKSIESLLSAVLTPLYHLSEDKRAVFLQDVWECLKQRGRIDDKGNIHLHVAQIELLVYKNP